MNEFDQFVKHKLKAKHYIRYADDFVIMSRERKWLVGILPKIKGFLADRLDLHLHPNKVHIKTFASGVDFLGWIHFPNHRVIRTATKRRMTTILKKNYSEQMRVSYLGMLTHGNTHNIARFIFQS